MAKRTKSLPKVQGFVLFDVTYADGSRASNRRVPAEILGGLDGDEPARTLITEHLGFAGGACGRGDGRVAS